MFNDDEALPPRDSAKTLDQLVIDAAPDGILLVDEDGTILLANPAVELITGYDSHEIIGESVNILLPEPMRARHTNMMAGFFRNPTSRRPMGMVSNLRLQRSDGTTVPVDIGLGQGRYESKSCAVVFLRDASPVRRLEEQMQFQATHDTLTGLANRWQFMQSLTQMMAMSARSQRSLGLLLLDLDDFKAINDGHGHDAGDQVLIEVARRLKGVLRAGDVLARLGGDEFTILLPEIAQPEDIGRVADKLIDVLSVPYRVNGYEVVTGASIGAAFYPSDAEDGQTLMRYADMAMYQAKAAGRNTYAIYQAAMGAKMVERIRLHDRLKKSIFSGGLELHYQPQVDTMSGQVVGVEALARWNDPELGEVPPARFIAVAESTGLILPLGDWVLETACRQLAQWVHAGRRIRMAINLSVRQFRQPGLSQRLAEWIEAYQLPAELIELEITESEAMAEPEQAQQILQELAEIGVAIALDDFGTGHSSLSYLRTLPVSRIKIDRVFIQNIPDREVDANLVKGVLSLAHTLGLEVVAEGVETPSQLHFLRENRCETYQGWLYAKAMPAADLQLLDGFALG